MKFDGFDRCVRVEGMTDADMRLKCRACDTITVFPDNAVPTCPSCGSVGASTVVIEADAQYRDNIVKALKVLGVANAEEIIGGEMEFVGEYVRGGHPWIAAALGILWSKRPESMLLRLQAQVVDPGETTEHVSQLRHHAATEAGYREFARDLMKTRESIVRAFQNKRAPRDQKAWGPSAVFVNCKVVVGSKHRLLLPIWASDHHIAAMAVLDCLRHKMTEGDFVRVEQWNVPPSEYLVYRHEPPKPEVVGPDGEPVTPEIVDPKRAALEPPPDIRE